MEYSSDWMYSPIIGAVKENYMLELRTVEVLPGNPEYSVIQHLSAPVCVALTEVCCSIIFVFTVFLCIW
jgi:hypothetical protein